MKLLITSNKRKKTEKAKEQYAFRLNNNLFLLFFSTYTQLIHSEAFNAWPSHFLKET